MTPCSSTPSAHSVSNPEGRPRCLYRGRACYRPRDMKPNGRLHRFCRGHRLQHNGYQRLSQRRRARAREQRRRLEAQQDQLTLIELTDAIIQDAIGLAHDLEPLQLDALGGRLHDAFLAAQNDYDAAYEFESVRIMGNDEIEDILALLQTLEDW